MKKVITGYSEVEIVGTEGDKLMDSLVDIAKESLGAKIESDDGCESPETQIYKVTLMVERISKNI